MQDVTKVVNMSEIVHHDQVEMLCFNGKTMLMMWEVTGDVKYLDQARLDLFRAKSIQECGFVRPLGVLLTG